MTRDIHFSHSSTHGGAAVLCRAEDGLHFVVSGLSTAYNTGLPNVFSADDNQLETDEKTHETALWYTFRESLVTCPLCIEELELTTREDIHP